MHVVHQFLRNQPAEGKQSVFSSDLPENGTQRRAPFHGGGYQEIPALTRCCSCRGKAPSEAFQTLGDFAAFKDTSETSVDLVMKWKLLNSGGWKKDSCALVAFHYLAVKISHCVGTYPQTEAFFWREGKTQLRSDTPNNWKGMCGAMGEEDQTFTLACLTWLPLRTNCSASLADTGAGGHMATERKYTHQNPNICGPSVLRAETCKSPVASGKKNTEREELLFYLWGTQRQPSSLPSHIWI